MFIFEWINSQVLRMDWLSDLVRFFIQNILGQDMDMKVVASIHFFIYDVIKIFILLTVLVFVISYIQSYFPPERTKKILGNMSGLKAKFVAALLGTLTPFCSCSSIPIFMGFTNSGLPVGVTFSFLISSPLVDLASVILLASIFNWTIALLYVGAGIVLSIMGGLIIHILNMDKYVEGFVTEHRIEDSKKIILTRKDRLSYSFEQVKEVFLRVWVYVLIGVGIGALIHNWIPEDMIIMMIGQEHWWSVLLATVFGIPIYADIFGTLPIAEAFVNKGVGLGTSLSFMMSATALSIPSLVMLKRVVKMPLLVLFTLIVTTGIIIIGYLFNNFSYLVI